MSIILDIKISQKVDSMMRFFFFCTTVNTISYRKIMLKVYFDMYKFLIDHKFYDKSIFLKAIFAITNI